MKYLLPKPHLSYSQMQIWMTSKERYRREYFEGGKKLDTKYLRFGSWLAKLIEEGKSQTLLPTLIVYPKREHVIEIEICGVPMLMKIDDYDPERNIFREKKSGKLSKKGVPPWSLSKVQKHEQLVVYAMGLKHSTGKMPKYCDLDWIETQVGCMPTVDFWHTEQGAISVTGKIESFHREFDEREVERMEKLIVKCAEEISEAYKNFIMEI